MTVPVDRISAKSKSSATKLFLEDAVLLDEVGNDLLTQSAKVARSSWSGKKSVIRCDDRVERVAL